MSHAALQLDTVGDLDWLNDSKTAFTNNTIHGSPFGVLTTFPYDVEVRSNIFCDTDVAVSRGGDPAYSGQVTHNCFFDNGADFSGYPSTYGTPIWPNHRGIPADLSYNIFEDPRFVDEESFLLAPDSPCVDSGCDTSNCPAELYFDVCVPPSRGTSINDIGAYGGPGACTLIPPTAVDTPFLRGDSDFDTDIQITDAIFVLGFLFLGKPSATTCAKAFDADDNAFIEITDAVWLLRYAFSGGDAPPAPFLACGSDPTNDALPCADYPPCT